MMILAHVRNDGLPFFVIVLMFGGVGVLILTAHHQARQRMARLCDDLARRLGGEYRPGGFAGNDQIVFRLLDHACVLEIQAGRYPYSHLKVLLPRDPGGWLRIGENGVGEFFLSLLQGQKFQTGDRNFDDAYAIRGWPEHLLRKVFSPERRKEAMRAIRRLNHCAGYSLEVKSGLLELRIREKIEDLGVGMSMVRTAEDFLRFLFDLDRAATRGIQFGEVIERLSGLCPICTTVLREPLVRCRRCQSPHHQECWEYLGRCATYGCDPKPGRRAA